MEETRNTEMPDYRRLSPVSENGGDMFFRKSPMDDYYKKEGKLPSVRDDLPPEHLTATYWG